MLVFIEYALFQYIIVSCVLIYAYMIRDFLLFFFFFQAEDGIRDKLVTGVQTCALPIYRAADGGVGDGQGGRGAPHPPRVAPRRGPVRRAELRGAAGGVARVGAVRLREGRLHRGRVGARGTARAGRGGNAVSRRSRRDEPGGAGEVPPGAPGAGVSAPRRHADAQGRRARHRRDEPRPEGGDDPGHVSRGSLLSVTRVRSEEHTSELQSLAYLVCRLLLEKKKYSNRTGTRSSWDHKRSSHRGQSRR